LVVGFDLVNEEDYNEGLDSFLDLFMEYKQRLGDKLQFFFHAGESYSKKNKEIYDAVLRGTKRIGHGLALAKSPLMIDLVKKNNICLEVCPVSNRILGYVGDLRCHPARGLISRGVKISINPDDQGFFDAKGVTLDYILAYLAWGLDLADLH